MRRVSRAWPGLCAAVLCAGARLHASDCDRNGVDDWAEIQSGAKPDCNGNGIPDGCDPKPVNFGLALERKVATGDGPRALAQADFDGDGTTDLAAVSDFASTVTLLLNHRPGGLGAGIPFRVADGPVAIFAAEWNADGKPDLVVVGKSGVQLLTNALPRAFEGRKPTAIDVPVTAAAGGDLDGDGLLDVALASQLLITPVFGEAAGTFRAGADVMAGSGPVAVALADMDGDHDLDVVTANSFQNVSVLKNDGHGALEPPRNFAAGSNPINIAAADLDGDGDADVAVADGAGRVSILLNRGNGYLDSAPDVERAGEFPFALALGDLDGDGDVDLAVGSGKLELAAILNHGDGTFAAPVITRREDVAQVFLAAVDLDADGLPEVVSASQPFGEVAVFKKALVAVRTDCDLDQIPDDCQLDGHDCNSNGILDSCDVRSGKSFDCDTDGVPDECEPDCNSNGKPDPCDLRAGTSKDCNSNGLPDECDTAPEVVAFRALDPVPTGDFAIAFDDGDIDGDGDLDVLAGGGQGLSGFVNDGKGALKNVGTLVPSEPMLALAAIDLDLDGDIDVAGVGRSNVVRIALGDGRGGFVPGESPPAPGASLAMVAADLDGDGDPDLVLSDEGSLEVSMLINQGSARFAPGPRVPLQDAPLGLAAGDLDGDGDADLLLAGRKSGSVLTITQAEKGRFTGPTSFPTQQFPESIAAADLNGDGRLDCALGASSSQMALVGLNDGGGRYPGFQGYSLDPVLNLTPVPIDVDRDGDLDLIILQASPMRAAGGGIALLNDHQGRFPTKRPVDIQLGLFVSLNGVLVADLDGDGDADLTGFTFLNCDLCEVAAPFAVQVLLNDGLPPRSLDRNQNGVPDECEAKAFHRGDADGDGALAITDAVTVLGYLFQGTAAPACLETADVDNDGAVSLTDAVSLLGYLFRGGPPPASPGPPGDACGLDPDAPGSAGDLGCADYGGCR